MIEGKVILIASLIWSCYSDFCISLLPDLKCIRKTNVLNFNWDFKPLQVQLSAAKLLDENTSMVVGFKFQILSSTVGYFETEN